MKSYPFAKFYLTLLLIMALLILLVGSILFFLDISDCYTSYHKLRLARSKPFIVDTRSLVSEMEYAISAIADVAPNTVDYSITPPSEIPIDTLAQIRWRDIPKLELLLSHYQSILSNLKHEFLAQFNREIEFLDNAALSQLAQIPRVQSDEIAYPRILASTRIFEAGARDVDAEHILDDITKFLSSGVQFYTPSSTAIQSANRALNNLQSAAQIYEADMAAIELQRSIRLLSYDRRPRGSQFEILNDFRLHLKRIKLSAHQLLLNRWKLDSSIERIMNSIQKRQNQVAALRGNVRVLLVKAFIRLFACMGAALLLMIMRDFLVAAIDTAQNTRDISNAFGQAQIEIEKR